MNLYKLANNRIVRASSKENGIFNPTEATLMKLGFKALITATKPQTSKYQRLNISYVEDENTITEVVNVEYISVEEAREILIDAIKEYDSSSNVNLISVSGLDIWLDKDTRVGLVNSCNAEESEGRSETSVWYNGVKLTFPIEQLKVMLNKLEVYAKECFNVTQLHVANVSLLETVEDIEAYDYKSGYPEKLVF